MHDGPSEHLSWSELACKDAARTPYPAHWHDRALELALEFEAIRAALRRPLIVLSAYRTPAHNRTVGGAPQSQHVEGRALDLRPPRGVSVAELYRVVWARALEAGIIGGVGRYWSFVHFDTRPRNGLRPAAWRGARVAADLEA